jgi:septal ring factor EnvC (AmiA/AmiB activator)
MTHPTNTGHGTAPKAAVTAQFDHEFFLLADLAAHGSNPEIERLAGELQDAESDRAQAEERAELLAAQLELVTGERDGALRQAAAAHAREGEAQDQIHAALCRAADAEARVDALTRVLEAVAAAVARGAADPLAAAVAELAPAGIALPAVLPAPAALAVAA